MVLVGTKDLLYNNRNTIQKSIQLFQCSGEDTIKKIAFKSNEGLQVDKRTHNQPAIWASRGRRAP